MSKNVYSLILSDEVIAAVDALAYRRGLSRSAMVNELLASAVSYITPEMRMQQIVDRLSTVLSDGVFLPMQSGPSVYSMRSRLIYKYNPSLRYSVELDRNPLPEIGRLKVGLRSRSDQLMLIFCEFFDFWRSVESEYYTDVDYAVEDSRIVRSLRIRRGNPGELTPRLLGDAIAGYVRMLNHAIGLYFEQSFDQSRCLPALRMLWRDYLHDFPMGV